MPSITEQEIEQKVIGIIAAISKRADVTIQINDSLVDDIGVDSIQFLEILAEIEDKFMFEMNVDDLRPELFRTIRSVIYFVKGRVNLT
jgi:acyl carrier protein